MVKSLEGSGKQEPINAAQAVNNELLLFPLFTKKALAKRWNVSYSVLCNWEIRNSDFPARITGMIVGEGAGGKGRGVSNSLYPACEVFAYERERNIPVYEGTRSELEPWGWCKDE